MNLTTVPVYLGNIGMTQQIGAWTTPASSLRRPPRRYTWVLEEVEKAGSDAQPVVLLDFIIYFGRANTAATQEATEDLDDEKIMETCATVFSI